MKWIIIFFFTILVSCGDSVEKVSHNSSLKSILWMQHSIEYEAISYQLFQTAELSLDLAMENSSWNAVTDEKSNTKPHAIIVYIDEVVLRSIKYNAGLLKAQLKESENSWKNWVNQVNADRIKGSVYFLRKAHAKGIKVFYLTRRPRSVIETTRLNLRNLGFPIESEFETILTPKNVDVTGKLRRELVAKNYRVLMIFGHDLSHFSEEFFELEIDERRTLLQKYRHRFGKEWFILPNPVYGSWNDALYYYDYQIGEKEKAKRKLDLLDY